MALDNTLTVVIPCRNEEKYIGKCLDSLIACDFPKDKLSVFVVDGESDDRTKTIVREYAINHSQIKLLINEKKTTPLALNLGIENSTSEFVAILGAHAEISKNYFSQCVEDFQLDNKIGCTGGLLINEYEDNVSEVIGMAQSSSFGVGNAHFRTGAKSGYVDTVAFGTYRKTTLDEIGVFDEDLVRNQDDELNYRVIKNGWKIYLNSSVTALYYVRGSFSKLYNQYWQYGYWKVYVNQKHNAITTVRQLVPTLFIAFLVLGLSLSFFSIWMRLLFSLGLLIYLYLAFIFALQKTKKPSNIYRVMGSFFILHISYGLGYWKGILDFIIKRKGPSEKSESLTR